MRGWIARFTPYVDAGSGFLLWQIIASVSAGFLFRVLRCFARQAAMHRVDPQNPQSGDSRNR
jgi:hypothetical protein